jgi:hypothetical protein
MAGSVNPPGSQIPGGAAMVCGPAPQGRAAGGRVLRATCPRRGSAPIDLRGMAGCATGHEPTERLPQETPPQAWESSAPGPYVTIRTGGPLNGLVTLIATGSEGRITVEASWGVPHLRTTATAERVGHAAAHELAQAWANERAVGREPQPD